MSTIETFEASGLQCAIDEFSQDRAMCYVAIPKGHAFYRCRRDVLLAVPADYSGRAVNPSRIAFADFPGKVPATLEAGAEVPASILLDVPGGIWFTGMRADSSGNWWWGFAISNDATIEEKRAELTGFAAKLAAPEHATITGGPAPFPELTHEMSIQNGVVTTS